jgi:hypothetical protein
VEDVIAERELEVVGSPSRKVKVRLSRPIQVDTGDWACTHRIVGLGDDMVGVTSGVDSMQALQLALDHVRTILEQSSERLAWFGNEEMGSGIPRSIPVVLPRSYATSIEQVIEGTMARWAEDLKCRFRPAK